MDLVTLHIAKRPDLFEKRDDGSYELEVDNLSSTALRFLQSAMDEVFGAPEGVEENQSATRPRSHSTDHHHSPSTLPSSSKLAPHNSSHQPAAVAHDGFFHESSSESDSDDPSSALFGGGRKKTDGSDVLMQFAREDADTQKRRLTPPKPTPAAPPGPATSSSQGHPANPVASAVATTRKLQEPFKPAADPKNDLAAEADRLLWKGPSPPPAPPKPANPTPQPANKTEPPKSRFTDAPAANWVPVHNPSRPTASLHQQEQVKNAPSKPAEEEEEPNQFDEEREILDDLFDL